MTSSKVCGHCGADIMYRDAAAPTKYKLGHVAGWSKLTGLTRNDCPGNPAGHEPRIAATGPDAFRQDITALAGALEVRARDLATWNAQLNRQGLDSSMQNTGSSAFRDVSLSIRAILAKHFPEGDQ